MRAAPVSFNSHRSGSFGGSFASQGQAVNDTQPGGAQLAQPTGNDVAENAARKFGILGVSKEVLVTVAFFSTVCHAGLIFGCTAFNSQLVKLTQHDANGYTEDNVGQIFSVGHNFSALACVFSGLVLDKLGPRACAVSGLLLEAVGHVLLAQTPEGWAMWTAELGFGFIALGGVQVLMAGLCFTEAFQKAAFVTSILSGAFDISGLTFMLLPVIATTDDSWAAFFYFFAVFAGVLAVLLFLLYPDQALDPYSDPTQENEMQASATTDKTLREVVCRPGVLWFLITYAMSGSVLVYGAGQFLSALRSKDVCSPGSAGECEDQHLQDVLNEQMMPLVSNLTIFASLALGWMCQKWGIAVGSFFNVAMVQAFLLSLWLLPLTSQWITVLVFNLANASVYTMQSMYVCQEGYNHIGTLFGISNLALGFGNFLTIYLNRNPFGEGESQAATSLSISCILWLALLCPAYAWVFIEIGRSRREEKLKQSPSTTEDPVKPDLEVNKIAPDMKQTEALTEQNKRSKAAAYPSLQENADDPTVLFSSDAAAANQQMLAHPILAQGA